MGLWYHVSIGEFVDLAILPLLGFCRRRPFFFTFGPQQDAIAHVNRQQLWAQAFRYLFVRWIRIRCSVFDTDA
jgi:hypothetical protein